MTRSSSESWELRFGYTNWQGRNSERRVRPISVRYGQSKWHPRDGWLMLALDLDKNEEREFSMRDMVMVERSDPISLNGAAQRQPEPAMWVCLVTPKGEHEEPHIRAWTTSAERAKRFAQLEGLEMRPLYASPVPSTDKEPDHG